MQRRSRSDGECGEVLDDASLMRTQPELVRQLARCSTRSDGAALWRDKLWPRVATIARALAQACDHAARPRARGFEPTPRRLSLSLSLLCCESLFEDRSYMPLCRLLGVDIVLDSAGRPWLLEANLSPALARRTETHARLISSMLEGVLRRTVDRWFPKGDWIRQSSAEEQAEEPDGWRLVTERAAPPPQRISQKSPRRTLTRIRSFGFLM